MTAPALTARAFRAAPSIVLGRLRFAPLAVALVLALAGSAALLREGSVTTAVVAWSSTNVHNLTSHPIAALISSAFVVPGIHVSDLVLVGLSVAVLERAIGARRTVAVALLGHVLATLLTEAGVAIGVAAGTLGASAADRDDVGISYVMYSVLAACVLLLPRRWRLLGVAGILAAVVAPFAVAHDMTSTGHVLSVCIGFAAMAMLRKRRSA